MGAGPPLPQRRGVAGVGVRQPAELGRVRPPEQGASRDGRHTYRRHGARQPAAAVLIDTTSSPSASPRRPTVVGSLATPWVTAATAPALASTWPPAARAVMRAAS